MKKVKPSVQRKLHKKPLAAHPLPEFLSLDSQSDSGSDNDQDDCRENNNVFNSPQEDSDDDGSKDWCEHLEASDGRRVCLLLGKRFRCITCHKKAHFSCIHRDCLQENSSNCCRNVSHIFSHMAMRDHPVILHHKLRVVLCTRCNTQASIRKFLRQCGVLTDSLFDKEMPPEEVELQAVCGMVNFGNTCYMNAVFQLLGHCSPFADFMASFRPPASWEGYPPVDFNATIQMAADFRKMWSGAPIPFISPWKIIYCIRMQLPGFESFQQQDATEFLRNLFEILDREMRSFLHHQAFSHLDEFNHDPIVENLGYESGKSLITELFQGTLENQIKCHSCGFRSRTYENFLDLSVPIINEEEEYGYLFKKPSKTKTDGIEEVKEVEKIDEVEEEPEEFGNDNGFEEYGDIDPGYLVHQRNKNKIRLDECLDQFFQNSVLDGDNQYSCSGCNKHVDATKSTKATKLPEVILIQLKRFRHTMYGTRKVDKVVEFPVRSLDFGRWTTSKESAKYDLVGFIVHEGRNVEYGHYVTLARHEQNLLWYKFDDMGCQQWNVFRVAKQQPYILMFQRRLDNETSIFTCGKERREIEYLFSDASQRFRDSCPGAWEIIQQSVENGRPNDAKDMTALKDELKLQKKPKGKNLDDLMGPNANAEQMLEVLNSMLTEIQESTKTKKSRKKASKASPDSSYEAICKLLTSIEKWMSILAKNRWIERQMGSIDQETDVNQSQNTYEEQTSETEMNQDQRENQRNDASDDN